MVQPGLSDGSPIAELLTAVGQAAYVWDIETDRLDWTAAAHEVLGLAATTPIDSASRFAALFDPDALTTRREAVFGASAPDHGHG
ncbi:GGDEF-domain containing protein, partial [Hansschlegelia beijingensis]